MTLDEAIQSQGNLLQDKSSNLIESEIKSIKLGREALLRVKYLRELDRRFITMLLPGETKD